MLVKPRTRVLTEPSSHVLVVLSHPKGDSLCASLSKSAVAMLTAAGKTVDLLDLYAENFAPMLTADERQAYYDSSMPAVRSEYTSRLTAASDIVLIFPTWWFSLPAILKGWFDRVWVPGVAFNHGTPITPQLRRLRSLTVVTTLGSPWWVDWLVMRRPVRKVLRIALLQACAPQARFEMISLYAAENADGPRVAKFTARMAKALSRIQAV